MDENRKRPEFDGAYILGMLLKWAFILAVALFLLQFLMWIAGPIIEHAAGFLSSIGMHDYSGDGIYSLATTCIILIGIVAAIKAMKK